jgi:hypothetical protein
MINSPWAPHSPLSYLLNSHSSLLSLYFCLYFLLTLQLILLCFQYTTHKNNFNKVNNTCDLKKVLIHFPGLLKSVWQNWPLCPFWKHIFSWFLWPQILLVYLLLSYNQPILDSFDNSLTSNNFFCYFGVVFYLFLLRQGLTMYSKLAMNSQSTFLSLLSTVIISKHALPYPSHTTPSL